MNILIVEDEETVISFIQFVIKEYFNHEVYIAKSKEEAFGVEVNVDLAICDIYLGQNADGIDVAKEMFRRGASIIMLTGSPDYLEKMGDAGITTYITKPFTPELLMLFVEYELLKRKL